MAENDVLPTVNCLGKSTATLKFGKWYHWHTVDSSLTLHPGNTCPSTQ